MVLSFLTAEGDLAFDFGTQTLWTLCDSAQEGGVVGGCALRRLRRSLVLPGLM